ncbi:MAG: response regulator [Polyangiaceae bacterium]|nr:response regulator [Polyangiaceae bacterium]
MSFRILVIDDDDLARTVLSETLRNEGCDVFELPSAIGAGRLITERNIRGVVLDVMLPDIDGDKLARMLRGNAKGSDLAIILVSSRPGHELELLAVEARADGVVNKAEIEARLWPTLRTALLRRGARATD